MKYLLFIAQFFIINQLYCQNIDTAIINLSRKSTLKIIAYDTTINGGKYGTGFFVKASNITYVITCLHVIKKDISENVIGILKTIKGITYNGDTIDLNFQAVGGVFPKDYLSYDYAILKCDNYPKNISTLSISSNNKGLFVGESIYFSGYPISCPMLSHTGTISGFSNDSSQIFIQFSINVGNSGGALLNSKGYVIGIMDFKNLQLSLDFDKYLKTISLMLASGQAGFSYNVNVDYGNGNKYDIEMEGEHFNYNLIKTLEDNLNTGIGGAINAKYIRKYLYK